MRFGPVDRILLFGGAPLLLATARMIRSRGLRVFVYTSPRHEREPLDATGVTLGEALRRERIEFVSTEDINTEPTLRARVTSTVLGLGMGEAWSFQRDLIEAFGGRLLDFMGIPLPRYRGGAHYTWMILRGDRGGACNLQIINEEMIQGERDTGALVKTRRYVFPESARTPLDYFEAAVPIEVDFIREFLDEVQEGKDFELIQPNEDESLFFPRLNTMTHGWIDWGGSAEDIVRFICAFDDPYPGASTFLGAQRAHLKGARVDATDGSFHPFQSGLVTRVSHGHVWIAAPDGHIVARVVSSAGEPLVVRPGARFITPAATLDEARRATASYGAKG